MKLEYGTEHLKALVRGTKLNSMQLLVAKIELDALIKAKENPIAYEFHNHETGHCYVDYTEREGMAEKDGYIKTSLYKV